jgi:hypothetical protein
MHLRNPTQSIPSGELISSDEDIILSPEAITKLALPSAVNIFENSLLETAKFMYISHPENFVLKIN